MLFRYHKLNRISNRKHLISGRCSETPFCLEIPAITLPYNATLHLQRYNSAHFVLPQEYSNRVSLLIQNRTTSHYAPKFMVIKTSCSIFEVKIININFFVRHAEK